MKKFTLISIFAALAAILSACANELRPTQTARQPDVFAPPPEPPPLSH